MNRSSTTVMLLVAGFGVACASCAKRERATPSGGSRGTRYAIDGCRDDWPSETQVVADLGGQGHGTFGNDIDIKEVCVDTDGTYLYVFLTCDPTIAERARSVSTSGILAYLYVDADRNPRTGASQPDSSGNKGMLGAEYQVWVPISASVTVTLGGAAPTRNVTADYCLKRWEEQTERFGLTVRNESGLDQGSLVADGSDGVELAIPLGDLGCAPGDEFDFLAIEWACNREDKVLRHHVVVGGRPPRSGGTAQPSRATGAAVEDEGDADENE